MIFTETKLKGAFVIDIERHKDSRGFFARAFCQREFETHGLKPIIAQANIAFNHRKGTMRGNVIVKETLFRVVKTTKLPKEMKRTAEG